MEISKETPDWSLQTESLIKGNNRDQIANLKVVVVTETINNNEKTKLRWSIFNLGNDKETEHSIQVTRSSTDFSKVASKKISVNLGNKHC